MIKERLIETTLNNLDTLGYQLQKYGVTDRVNRHNLIALAITQQDRLEGELVRIELKLESSRAKAASLYQSAQDIANFTAGFAPKPLAKTLRFLAGTSRQQS